MSLFGRLFGGGGGGRGGPSEPAPTDYKGCSIFAEPVKDSEGYRVAARIEKAYGDEIRQHHLIRADVCSTWDDAAEIALAKAKLVIDQLGDGLFD